MRRIRLSFSANRRAREPFDSRRPHHVRVLKVRMVPSLAAGAGACVPLDSRRKRDLGFVVHVNPWLEFVQESKLRFHLGIDVELPALVAVGALLRGCRQEHG